MEKFLRFLHTSYTCYHAVENAADLLEEGGFLRLQEELPWNLEAGKKYFTVRDGSLVAFRMGESGGHGEENYKIVACHTDSPCFKLKYAPSLVSAPFTRLNVEPYGGGIWYTFFDRPLRIAGRIVRKENGALVAENYVSEQTVVIPSLAVHQNRTVNEGFSPDLQTDTLPLWSLSQKPFEAGADFDLYAVPDCAPFFSGESGEFLSSPRLDDLAGVYAALEAMLQCSEGTCIAALFDSEEIGSRTRQGAAGNLLAATLKRISFAQGKDEEAYLRTLASSFCISLDNAHSLHPNHPEKCDPTNRAVMGGGVVIKSHAGGAYTTNALTAAAMRELLERNGIPHQNFFNRSDMRSGSTLGAISLGQVCVPTADIGIAQLAMHSAVETMASRDYDALKKALCAFYASHILVSSGKIEVE